MSEDPCKFNDPNKKFAEPFPTSPPASPDLVKHETELEQEFFRYEWRNFLEHVAPNTDYNILYEKAMFFDTLVALVQGEFQSRKNGIKYRGQLDLAIEGLKVGSLKSFFTRSGANYNITEFPMHVKGAPLK